MKNGKVGALHGGLKTERGELEATRGLSERGVRKGGGFGEAWQKWIERLHSLR